jgi:hypothetical protein
MTVPLLEGDQLIDLLEFIAGGLAFWHWETCLPPDKCLVKAPFFTSAVRAV